MEDNDPLSNITALVAQLMADGETDLPLREANFPQVFVTSKVGAPEDETPSR